MLDSYCINSIDKFIELESIIHLAVSDELRNKWDDVFSSILETGHNVQFDLFFVDDQA